MLSSPISYHISTVRISSDAKFLVVSDTTHPYQYHLDCHLMISFWSRLYLGLTHWPSLVISLGLSVCAMFSKEQGVTVLGLCLAYDFFVLSQVRKAKFEYNVYSVKL